MGKRQRRRQREVSAARQPRDGSSPNYGPLVRSATERLVRLVDQRTRIETAIDDEIEHLRGSGLGWPSIARGLGVTRQAARQRQIRHVRSESEQQV
jgi:hypothetical protein